MRGILGSVAAVALGCLVAVPAGAADVSITCKPFGLELEFCERAVELWSRETGHVVTIVPAPNSSTEHLMAYREMFAGRGPQVDVLQIDVVWTGELADRLLDLGPYVAGAASEHFGQIVANNTVDGRLVALPWFADVGILYMRSDLLAKYGLRPPATLADLEASARLIQDGERAAGNAAFHGFVFQGAAYEGLTCNVLEWVAGAGGGGLVEPDGSVTVDNPAAAAALDRARSWIGSIAPPEVLTYDEEATRAVFQAGNAAFMRNWPYATAPMKRFDSPIRSGFAVAPMPPAAGGTAIGTLGGWQLAVSGTAKNPDVAAALVLYLTSAREQTIRALAGNYLPTRPSLYDDPDLQVRNRFLSEMRVALDGAKARPPDAAGPRYAAVSEIVWSEARAVLEGKATGAEAVSRMAKALRETLAAP